MLPKNVTEDMREVSHERYALLPPLDPATTLGIPSYTLYHDYYRGVNF